MSGTFDELLARDGVLVYKTKGVSMRPMLRQNRDLVMIRVPEGRLKPLDVALYRRGDAYVLHRVIEVREGYYLIRGDNTYALETVPDDAVIGVLTGFQRNGKEIGAEDKTYRAYVRFWNAVYPVRAATVCGVRLAERVLKKMGFRRRRSGSL
jgi:hypothetical protein